MKISKLKIKEWIEEHNPYHIWWQCKKYFKKPKWKLYNIGKVTWFYGLPINLKYYNSILSIKVRSLGWKDKFCSPRHEWDPFIAITLFRKWQVIWIFTYGKDGTQNLATWEAMLDYLYYNVPLSEIRDRHIWTSLDEHKPVITIDDNLKCCM